MVKVLEEKGTREATVGYRRLNLITYCLEVNPTHLTTPKEAKGEVCRLCYLGEGKKKGLYSSLEEKRACDDCATDMNRKHSQAKKEGKKFVVEIESCKLISPALTAFAKNDDQPTIKGLEEDF
jgi:hypothetical protein